MNRDQSLRITEIFHSLQGETNTVGLPTVFVRLTGCPLRCQYCDSAYAFHGGTRLSFQEILDQVAAFKAQYVTVSGGEPLAQPAVHDLMRQLCDLGYRVSIETSGALSVANVDPRVVKVVDFKTPASLEMSKNDLNNLKHLTAQDQVKFVICDRDDYLWAKDFVAHHQLIGRCEVLFSPSYEQVDYKDLSQWILDDRLPVRFQIQLHKVIWGDRPGV